MARDPRVPPELPPVNPYAAPSAFVADVAAERSEAEAIREAHIRHERQLKGIGSLYVLGTIGGVLAIIAILGAGTSGRDQAFVTGFLVLYAAITLASAFTAFGYRRLRPWVKVPGGILSALGLLAFPVGTLINA